MAVYGEKSEFILMGVRHETLCAACIGRVLRLSCGIQLFTRRGRTLCAAFIRIRRPIPALQRNACLPPNPLETLLLPRRTALGSNENSGGTTLLQMLRKTCDIFGHDMRSKPRRSRSDSRKTQHLCLQRASPESGHRKERRGSACIYQGQHPSCRHRRMRLPASTVLRPRS